MKKMAGVIALQLLAATPLAGQDATPADSSTRYHTVSLGGAEGTFLATYRWTGPGPGGGVELTLTTLPEALAYRIVVVAAHIGPTLWLYEGSARPFLRAGVGGIVVAGGGFDSVAPTAYYGAGLLAVGSSGPGVRLDGTRYCGVLERGCLSVIEIGLTWAVGRRVASLPDA